jgi:nucleoside-diphosphate-sugar epimerase
MKAFITGIDGFTGRYMAAELVQAGYDVFGLSPKQNVSMPNVRSVFACDLCDSVSLTNIVKEIQPDVVVHLAAISFVQHGDASEIYRVNLIGTRNLLDVLSRTCKSIKSVLIASSANVYGNTTGGSLDETTFAAPCNDYAVSKLAMEYMAKLFMDRLPIIITRPFNYTGVGQADNFLLPKIVSHVCRKADVIELGNIDVARDFSDVRVVVQYYRRLLESTNLQGETFNICSGQAYTLNQILSMIKEISSHAFEVNINPAFVRASEVKTLIGNPAKLHAQVGSITDISLIDTLKWMLEK